MNAHTFTIDATPEAYEAHEHEAALDLMEREYALAQHPDQRSEIADRIYRHRRKHGGPITSAEIRELQIEQQRDQPGTEYAAKLDAQRAANQAAVYAPMTARIEAYRARRVM